MKYLFAVVLSVLPVMGLTHAMSPGFETEYSVSELTNKTYTLENSYDFPITLAIEVFEKNWSPALGWAVDKETFKMLPNSKKKATITFESIGVRKIIVCSTLKGIGYEEEPPSIISRVCSRLIINGVSRERDN